MRRIFGAVICLAVTTCFASNTHAGTLPTYLSDVLDDVLGNSHFEGIPGRANFDVGDYINNIQDWYDLPWIVLPTYDIPTFDDSRIEALLADVQAASEKARNRIAEILDASVPGSHYTRYPIPYGPVREIVQRVLDQIGSRALANGFSPFERFVGTDLILGDGPTGDGWPFDGSGGSQILHSNLGTMIGTTWSDGDFNFDGDVDVWAFDGTGDAQLLSSNLGAVPNAPVGTVEAVYNAATGDLTFDVGEGIAVVGVMTDGMNHGTVDAGSIFGAPGQNGGNVLAYFNTSGLAVGIGSVGSVLPAGLTADDISFSFTPIGGDTTIGTATLSATGTRMNKQRRFSPSAAGVTAVPEPSTWMLLLAAGLGLTAIRACRRR